MNNNNNLSFLSLNNGIIYRDAQLEKRNILIQNGKILKISSSTYSNARQINCQNLWILPGIIDSHVHLRNPGYSEKETWITGTKAALKGGITTLFDMPNTNPPTIDLDTLQMKINIAKKESLVNYGFFIGANKDNINSILNLQDKFIGIKIYFGPTTGQLILNEPSLIRKLIQKSTIPIAFHSEKIEIILKREQEWKDSNLPIVIKHAKIRNIATSTKAIQKILKILFSIPIIQSPILFCHISSLKELQLIQDAKKVYKNIYSEACPHHLFLNHENMASSPFFHYLKANPPIRSKKNQQELYDAFLKNQLDIISTDHAPHLIEEKKNPIYLQNPSGVPGLETSFSLLLTEMNRKNISLSQIIEKTVENPVQLFSISNKGKIQENYDADLTIISPHESYILKDEDIQTKSKWNPFIGKSFTGKILGTIVNGRIGYWKDHFFKIQGKPLR